MIWIFAIAIIILGLYLVISGLREESRIYKVRGEEFYRYDDHKEDNGKREEIKGGGVILIGPIPIVFGDGKFAVIALLLAIILMLLSIFLIFSLNM